MCRFSFGHYKICGTTDVINSNCLSSSASLLSVLSLFVSEDVCKRGFTVIIDMRGSKWELIKPLLKTLQEFFPAEICVALIIKPDNFWQKQKTNFGSAKFSFEVGGLPGFSLSSDSMSLIHIRFSSL